MSQPKAQEQINAAQAQLLNSYVQREKLRLQLEQIDQQIAAFTNLLAGAQLGQQQRDEAVPPPPPPAVVPAAPVPMPVPLIQ